MRNLQGGAGGHGLGYVDMNFGCSTTLLWEIDAPPPEALWIWKMPRDAMGRPRPESVARGRGRPMAARGIFHIHKAEGGGASIT